MTITPAKLADSLASLQQLFTRSDTSKNGSLNKTEFTSALSGIKGTGGATSAEAANLFASMDTNGDGELTKAELADGIKLAEQVQKALLMAQELMSGATLMNMIGNKDTSSNSAAASMFSSGEEDASIPGTTNLADILGSEDTETTSTDAYTTQLQQLIAKYNAAATSTVDAKNAATASVNQTA